MDVARQLLNNLMGRDRNKPKGDMSGRDHYSNRDVCKPYLICFCFNTLFPNTVYDEGPCNKRHDTYLKNMFDNDLNRKQYEKEYIKQCINWIQKRLIDVQQKIKKNQSLIETKTTFTGDRPKGVLDRIIAIDADIQNMMKQAEVFGQQGQIDDSVRCLEEVDRLRQRRRQIESMNDTNNNVQKQQKICEICGAIQTINDTQKRIQTHLQGKIHQGFLKLRHEVQTLKVRLEILTQMDPKQKKQKQNQKDNKQKQKQKQKEKQREREKQKQRQRERERQKEREKQKQRQQQRQRQRQKQRQNRQKQKIKQSDRDKQRQRDRERDKYGEQNRRNYDMIDEKERKGDRSHSHKKKKQKDRERSRQKKHKKQKQDKYRSRDDEQKYLDQQRHDKKQKKKHKKERERSRQRDRYQEKRQHDRQREHQRDY